ncbi:hypothetical protein GH714_000205 [Hevea brasiliensis]|uniref:Pentatricopeptide repeat-containing protein n=1 Tax=Hevea brasiliensis TaxID=3981 RepID=A0A6A6M6Y9_HEVBR|nr:hypothetical protein GH714_000205 [Hevea brasiliensis]
MRGRFCSSQCIRSMGGKLEPTNVGIYGLLADIYAEAGMWDGVKGVKKLLETQGLQKAPGPKWIEAKIELYSFVSVVEFNP